MANPPGETHPDQWRRCSSCKKPILFGADYFVCNVSTCNRGTKGFVFCTVSCWDAHLGVVRHRESWAEDAKAPTREAYEREQAGGSAPKPKASPSKPAASRPPAGRTVITRKAKDAGRDEATAASSKPAVPAATKASSAEPLPDDVLIVISKLKKYVKAKAGFNCSDRVAGPLSDAVRALCDEAIENAMADERKTLLDRDFKRR